MDAIRATGYGAELPRPDDSRESLLDAQDAARAEEMRELRWKLLVSLAAAAVAMVFSLPLMESLSHGAIL